MKTSTTARAARPLTTLFSDPAPPKWLALLAAASVIGCSRETPVKVAELPEPKVDGDKVAFVTNAPQLASIAVQAAQARTMAVTHVTGRLYWNDDTTVRVFTPVAGRVTTLRAELGQPISVGTPLAEIDSPDFAQALASARTAAGNLAAADKAFVRSKELLAHGAAAEKDVEAAEAAYVAAAAERDRAEAVLANYGGSDQSTNSIYVLRSPIAGVLVEKNINPGQELRADLMLANAPNLFAPSFVVSDPAKLWLQLDVAESDLSALRQGQRLQITSAALPGKVFGGAVDNLGAAMDATARTIKSSRRLPVVNARHIHFHPCGARLSVIYIASGSEAAFGRMLSRGLLRMRAVPACADVGGVERTWANEQTLPCRGSTLDFTTSLKRARSPLRGDHWRIRKISPKPVCG